MEKVKKLIAKEKKSEKFINLKSTRREKWKEKKLCALITHIEPFDVNQRSGREDGENGEKIIFCLIRLNPEKILQINPYNIPFLHK